MRLQKKKHLKRVIQQFVLFFWPFFFSYSKSLFDNNKLKYLWIKKMINKNLSFVIFLTFHPCLSVKSPKNITTYTIHIISKTLIIYYTLRFSKHFSEPPMPLINKQKLSPLINKNAPSLIGVAWVFAQLLSLAKFCCTIIFVQFENLTLIMAKLYVSPIKCWILKITPLSPDMAHLSLSRPNRLHFGGK